MRVVCILLIIMYHYVAHGSFFFREYIPQKLFYSATGIWGLAGVLGFVMVSSHFLYSSGSFSIQKALRTVFEAAFYSTAITLILIFTGQIKLADADILKCVFSFYSRQYWFITDYVLFYMLTPFIKLLCDNLSIRNHRLFLIVFYVIAFIMNSILHVDFLSRLGIFVYIYILVAYLNKKPDNFFQRNYKWMSATVFALTMTIVCLLVFFSKNGNNNYYGVQLADISAITSSLMFAAAVCLYFIFKNMNIKYSKLLTVLGSSTLGIYLIHEHDYFHKILFSVILKRPQIYDMTLGPLFYILSCIAALFACTLVYRLCEFILDKTIYALTDKYLKKRYESFDSRYVPGREPADNDQKT